MFSPKLQRAIARVRARERESVFDLRAIARVFDLRANICVVCSCVPYIMHFIKRLLVTCDP